MLTELHQVLKDLILAKGKVNSHEIDVTFEVPSKEWADKLVRPTINLYPFELQENLELRQAQFQARRTNGHTELRAMPRRIDVRYVVTAMTTDSDDAFRLLWRVLGVLIRTPEIDPALFPDEVRLDAPIVTQVAQADSGIKLLDVWSALSAEPHAAFCLVVTLPVDLELEFPSPLVLGATFAFKPILPRGDDDDPDELPPVGPPEVYTQIHGVVHDASGRPVPKVTVSTAEEPYDSALTNKKGMFTLHTPEKGKVPLRLSHADGRSGTAEVDLDLEHQSAYELVLG